MLQYVYSHNTRQFSVEDTVTQVSSHFGAGGGQGIYTDCASSSTDLRNHVVVSYLINLDVIYFKSVLVVNDGS